MFIRREEEEFEVFDSLGTTLSYIQNTFQDFRGECVFNQNPIQAKNSLACGEFCLFYVIQRYFNEDLDFEEILEEWFSVNLHDNEIIVKTFLRHESDNK